MSSAYSNGHAEDMGAGGIPPGAPPMGDYGEAGDRASGGRGDGDAGRIRAIEDIEVPDPGPPLVGRIAPAPGSLTICYGDPGVGKSYAALGWAQRVIRGGGRVLVIDYEAEVQAWVHRSRDIKMDRGLFYVDPLGKPITSQAWGPWTADGFALVIIDSVLMAMGDMGEAEWSPRNPLAFVQAVQTWPCPVLGIAHQGPRTSGGGVFGSKYWTALAGMVWHITRDADEGRVLKLVKNRYGPDGERWLLHLHQDGIGPIVSISETPAS